MITTEQKEEMFKLRAEGWNVTKIGERYGLDHSTIVYHLKRPGTPVVFKRTWKGRISTAEFIKPLPVPAPEEILRPEAVKAPKLVIRPTKSYAEYLEEDRRRRLVWNRLKRG